MLGQRNIRSVGEAPSLGAFDLEEEGLEGDVLQLEHVGVELDLEVVFGQRRDDASLERLEREVGRLLLQQKLSEQGFAIAIQVIAAAGSGPGVKFCFQNNLKF